MSTEIEETEPAQKPALHVYSKPTLIVHGTVSNLTASGSFGVGEGNSSSPNKQRA